MDSVRDLPKEGLPHSDIRGSTIARISPRLFAACHVLHRLLAPRHPPNALVSLTIHSPQRPHAVPNRATNPQCTTASPTLTINNLHFHSQIHLSKINPGENKPQPRGSLGSGPAGDQRSRPRPARCPTARGAALQDIKRGERSRMIRQVVLFRKVATRAHPHPTSRTILERR